MKANSKKTSINIMGDKLKRIPLNKLSKDSGFCKRKSRKIKPKDFLIGFFIMAFSNENNSYRNWATKIGELSNQIISKQALWKRMHEGQILFLEKVVKFIIRQKVKQSQRLKKSKGLNQFRNILLEDSTHIKINNKLSKYYPGNGNGDKGVDKAIIKIQTVYNLLKDKFEKLEITSYRKNDQSVSEEILQIAKKGDLIIRDLGYFVLKAFRKISENNIYFISKLKNGINIISKDTEKPIDLAKMLKKRGQLDIEVLLGEKEKLPVRIIAIPLEEAVAANRRRRAKQDRDRRMNPSKKRLFLLGWEIFITNISEKKLSFKEIADIYRIRWRIEIIFKSWKSYFKITKIPAEANKIRVESFIYCMLIFITLFVVTYYKYYSTMYSHNEKVEISLLKLAQFIVGNLLLIFISESLIKNLNRNSIDKLIKYYCSYESRSDRLNFNQKIKLLS